MNNCETPCIEIVVHLFFIWYLRRSGRDRYLPKVTAKYLWLINNNKQFRTDSKTYFLIALFPVMQICCYFFVVLLYFC